MKVLHRNVLRWHLGVDWNFLIAGHLGIGHPSPSIGNFELVDRQRIPVEIFYQLGRYGLERVLLGQHHSKDRSDGNLVRQAKTSAFDFDGAVLSQMNLGTDHFGGVG